MPLKSLMGDFRISFNGEIYNYKELKEILITKGFKFHSDTDTEVVINSYVYWGEDFVSKLNGIFAFIIFDKKKDKIISARDRFGAKPLFYCIANDFIGFASDFHSIKSFIPKKELEIDLKALNANLMCRFVPGHKTIFKNINKLEPAEVLTFDTKNLKINKKSYWKAKLQLKQFSQDEFNSKLSNTLIKTSIADVKPAILLSGGLDSSSIVSELSNNSKETLKTYSCSFSSSVILDNIADTTKITNGSPDESAKAFKVADTFKTNHDHLIIDSLIDFDTFKDMQKALGEPVTVTNALGLYLFGKKLNGKTRLALSGTGSDELLGGYEELYFNNLSNDKKILSNKELLNSFCDFDNGGQNPINFLRKDIQDLSYLEEFTEKKMNSFLDNKFSDEYLNQLSIFELSFALPYWELDMADRLFMNFSIELRPSFLENDFLDYCLTIPSLNKKQKSPLRKAMKDSLPSDILYQRKLPSLSTPIDFLNSSCFQDLIKNLKDDPLEIWDKQVLFNYLEKPYNELSFEILYRLVYMQSWLKQYYYNDYKYYKVTK